MGFGRVS